MKKIVLMLVICALCLGVAACTAPAPADETTQATTQPANQSFDWDSVQGLGGSGSCDMQGSDEG